MSAGGSLAKATIVKLNKQGHPSGSPVQVLFNPKELSISKQNTWKTSNTPKTNVPSVEFGGGGAASLNLQLFFDTYAERQDVRKKYTDPIYALTQLDPEWTDPKTHKSRPASVRFQWGQTIGFDAVVASVKLRFTLFLPESGAPARAVVDIAFTQVKDELFYPSQNPTSGGPGGERLWTVKAGDTLAWIAFKEYNDPNQWRRIADANRLTQVRHLRPGSVLMIPNA